MTASQKDARRRPRSAARTAPPARQWKGQRFHLPRVTMKGPRWEVPVPDGG